MRVYKYKKILISFFILCVVAMIFGIWCVGSFLISARNQVVGDAPIGVNCENVAFKTSDNIDIKGWYLNNVESKKTIILLHGVKGCRLNMLDRAKFLYSNGFSVLLFDFRGHGESSVSKNSFGYFEANDVRASLQYVKSKTPNNEVYMIGVSMGAAALSLSHVCDQVNGVILEQMYPTLEEAIKDRIEIRLGRYARFTSFFLTCQVKLRIGVSVDEIAPIHSVSTLSCKKLFIAGQNDKHTKLNESQQIFNTASAPKDFVIMKGAEHVDLYKYDSKQYAKIILPFLNK